MLPPIIAIATKGQYYLRRTDDGIDLPMYDEHGNPSGEHLQLPRLPSTTTSGPTWSTCATHDALVCSLCLSTDKIGEHVLPAQV